MMGCVCGRELLHPCSVVSVEFLGQAVESCRSEVEFDYARLAYFRAESKPTDGPTDIPNS